VYRNGHYGVALLAFAPVGASLVTAGFTEFAVVVGAGSLWLVMLPDVDHRIPGVSHRGITHTVWFALLVGAALGAAGFAVGQTGLGAPSGPEPLALVGATTGLLSVGAHLVADTLTPMGIRPLWPLSRRTFTFSVVTADSRAGNYGLLSVGVFVTAAWVAVLVVA
jgi:inner membrane protein